MPLKIYVEQTHDDPRARPYLTDIVRALWMEKSQAQQHPVWRKFLELFELTSSIDQADLCVLPMVWSYYLSFNRTGEAYQIAEMAKQHGKRIAIWLLGDRGARISIDNAVLFQASIYRSKRTMHQYTYPAMFDDYAPVYFDDQLEWRKKGTKPVVGFCGQAVGVNPRTCLL